MHDAADPLAADWAAMAYLMRLAEEAKQNDELLPTRAPYREHSGPLSLRAHGRPPCNNCARNEWIYDPVHCDHICSGCGLVDSSDVLVDSAYSSSRTRESAPYNGIYHLNEVLAAYECRGPKVPDVVLDHMRAYLAYTPIVAGSITDSSYRRDVGPLMMINPLRLTIEKMGRGHIRQMCAELGYKKYAERWVQIKSRLQPDWKITYPSSTEMYYLRRDFAEVSKAFHRVLYRQGRKRTHRDNLSNSTHALSRHNLPHYSWIIQNLLYRQGGRELLDRIDADTFFPIQRTAQVKKKLRNMWCVICKELDWKIEVI